MQLWTGEWHATGTNPQAECSGVAASKANPGILWMHEDSGSGPHFLAVHPDGTVAHRYRMMGFISTTLFYGARGIFSDRSLVREMLVITPRRPLTFY